MVIYPVWGKFDKDSGSFHHLAHHSADVAGVFLALMEHPLYLRSAQNALGRAISPPEIECLAALVFLHDIGKLAPGFQAKARILTPAPRPRGHLECGWHWLSLDRDNALGGAVTYLAGWPGITDWFPALFAHHGRPTSPPTEGTASAAFPKTDAYNWQEQEAVMGQALLSWFPAIRHATAPPPTDRFLHFFVGLLTLADWVGSDRTAFPFEHDFRDSYWDTAKDRARERVHGIGLAPSAPLKGKAGWSLISDHPAPRPAQTAVGALPTEERLVILEAETGAGKTEAALWRFMNLLEAGEVDGLYFAVPTRAAARQLHRRVNAALKRMFDAPAEAVLAIPGQALAGENGHRRLPDFSVLWDDNEAKPSRWAAEHAARFLAARIAIGTVDQIALGGLETKYAHLRGSSLARALLVIDEVHASDPYMTRVQHQMVKAHMDLGGHVLMMSATLGAAARRKWRNEPPSALAVDIQHPYPAIWTSQGVTAISPDPEAEKRITLSTHADWSPQAAADMAIKSARDGARVLVIRNTVAMAQDTFDLCRAAAPDLLLHVNGTPTLHHSRFAVEDRALLDQAVERAIGKDSPLGGRIVIGTQTLEQSLDLCADFLITDLCPMDVLLQRLGRLHRHKRARPQGFEHPRAVVMCPQTGLTPLTKRAENGLGALAHGPTLSGIYVDLSGLAATLREIEKTPTWHIPAMNRRLVEAATHPEATETLAEDMGWQDYHMRVMGRDLAQVNTAQLVTLNRDKPISPFPSDEVIKTRLGEEGAILTFPPTIGPFGTPISKIALPAHWSRGLQGDEVPQIEAGQPVRISLPNLSLAYGPAGLTRGVMNAT